jgi:hypothetical protein
MRTAEAATASEAQLRRCPFPECAKLAEHDGDHAPAFRLIQQFTTKMGGGCCENGECLRAGAALYARTDGSGIVLCSRCEEYLVGGQHDTQAA